ncbi:membrane protein involved in aromatic hydrocarbon degradation [Methylobacterium sp. 4-46]|uniref:OmpP1/FadL family transporter n=1 Tax=unclassified Methylobacterium TaxID=2615210 RepID=UPI000152CD4A|nr:MULTISPECIES: outer membrane protein transport protein [Methylobacterium]ACA20090.1 membrane protein involved in aromatic hydrocarbon degradation [Methylobacterium sp. 4-46]WFT79276.1 outer membrane protein transport protein [Methylobacterium nodulans]
MLSSTSRAALLAALAFGAGVAGADRARAGAFGLREQSAEAQGLAFAGAAAGSGGLSSMFWNPAAVTMKPGWNSDYNATVIVPQATFTTQPGTFAPLRTLGESGDIGQAAVLPATYTNYQLGERLFLGLAGAAPFGLVTKPNQVWAGQTYSRSSRIFSLNFNPVIGYRVTDWLSVAAGPTIEYFKLKLRQAVGISPLAPSALLKGDDWGVGFTAGLLIQPTATTTLGVGFRSSIHHELDGVLSVVPGRVRSNLNTPEKLSVGLTQGITPEFRINLGFEWDNWSRLGTPAIVSQSLNIPVSALPLRYRDGFHYSVGGEYDVSPQWTLRAGFAYEVSPITDANRSTRLPDGDRYWGSIGASYRYSDKIQFDVAYSHLFAAGRNPVRIVPGDPLYVAPLAYLATTDTSADVVSVGIKYRWDTPAAPLSPAPIIRKY